jgi:hypothetical protein
MEDTLNPVLLGLFFIATCSICLSGFSIVMVRILNSPCLHSCTSLLLCLLFLFLPTPSLSFFLHFWLLLPSSPLSSFFYLFIPSPPSPLLSLSLCFCLFPIILLCICSYFSLITFLSFFTYCFPFLTHSILSHSFLPLSPSILLSHFPSSFPSLPSILRRTTPTYSWFIVNKMKNFTFLLENNPPPPSCCWCNECAEMWSDAADVTETCTEQPFFYLVGWDLTPIRSLCRSPGFV